MAMLVGAEAPLTLDRGLDSFHSDHNYDFWMPHPESPFPEVDGPGSKDAYLQTLERCYRRWRAQLGAPSGGVSGKGVEYVAMHAPYNKLVRRGLARMVAIDAEDSGEDVEDMDARAEEVYEAKGKPAEALPRIVGNMYTASVFASLASVVIGDDWGATDEAMAQKVAGQRVLCFSYGSGSTGALFSLTGARREGGRFTLETLCGRCRESALPTLEHTQRRVEKPEAFSAAMDARVAAWGAPLGASDLGPVHGVVPIGAYYLDSRDDRGRAVYLRNT